MCDGGVVSVPLALAIIGAGTAVYTQKQSQKALNEQAQAEQDQQRQVAAQEINERRAAARQERAAARASAAEAAVGGNSLNALEADAEAAAGRDISTIESNLKSGVAVSEANRRGQSRVASAQAVAGVTTALANGAASVYSNYTIKSGKSGKSTGG